MGSLYNLEAIYSNYYAIKEILSSKDPQAGFELVSQ